MLVLEPKEPSYQSLTLVLEGKQLQNRSLSSHHLCKPAGFFDPKTLDLALSDPRKLCTKEIFLKIISQFNNHLSSTSSMPGPELGAGDARRNKALALPSGSSQFPTRGRGITTLNMIPWGWPALQFLRGKAGKILFFFFYNDV